jgi:hypothetical protein
VSDDGDRPAGGLPAGDLPEDEPVAERGRRPWILVGVGAVVVVAVIVVLAVLAGRPSGYSDATRQQFLSACTADGGESVRDACTCVYDRMVAAVPYDRFTDVDQQLRAQFPSTPVGEELALPDDVQAIVVACRVTR